MTVSGGDELLVGQNVHGAQTLRELLLSWGFRGHFASNMRAAFKVLSSWPVDLALRNTALSDGSDFGLLMALTGLPVSAFVCLPVENSCFGCLPLIVEKNGWDCQLSGLRSLRVY